jgi:hypothetical protein
MPGLDTILNEGWYNGTRLTAHPSTIDPRVYDYGTFVPDVPGSTPTAYFKMELAPFGLDAMAWVWKSAFHTKLEQRPIPTWVIRNGLNDEAQTPVGFNEAGITDYGTDFANYGKPPAELAYPAATAPHPHGAISIAVVDPAAEKPYGIYEDNNPWPLAGTEDKTNAELDAWIADYGNSQSPPVTVATTADMQTAAGR